MAAADRCKIFCSDVNLQIREPLLMIENDEVRGVEEIVAVRTFRSRLPVRRVRHMDRRGQEVQNNFLTDHIINFLSGSPVRSEGRSGPPAPAPSSSTGYHDGCDRNAPFHRGDPANH